MTVMYELIW